MRKTWGGCNCNTLQDSYPAISYNCVHMYLMSCINNPWDFFFFFRKMKNFDRYSETTDMGFYFSALVPLEFWLGS